MLDIFNHLGHIAAHSAKALRCILNHIILHLCGNMSKMIENIEHMDSMLNSLKQANDRIVENIMQISATAEEVTAASTQAENLSNQNLENAENAQQLLTSVLSVSEKLNTYQAQE